MTSLRPSAGLAGTVWGSSPHSLSSSGWSTWAHSCGDGRAPWKQQERTSPRERVFLQASACVACADVPLAATVIHMAKPRVNVGRGYLQTEGINHWWPLLQK